MATDWDTINLVDRVRQSLATKVESSGRMPERAMLNCADVEALADLVDARRTPVEVVPTVRRPVELGVELLVLDSGDV